MTQTKFCEALAAVIRSQREKRGLTMQCVADEMAVALNTQYNRERQASIIPTWDLCRYAALFGVRPERLLRLAWERAIGQ